MIAGTSSSGKASISARSLAGGPKPCHSTIGGLDIFRGMRSSAGTDASRVSIVMISLRDPSAPGHSSRCRDTRAERQRQRAERNKASSGTVFHESPTILRRVPCIAVRFSYVATGLAVPDRVGAAAATARADRSHAAAARHGIFRAAAVARRGRAADGANIRHSCSDRQHGGDRARGAGADPLARTRLAGLRAEDARRAQAGAGEAAQRGADTKIALPAMVDKKHQDLRMLSSAARRMSSMPAISRPWFPVTTRRSRCSTPLPLENFAQAAAALRDRNAADHSQPSGCRVRAAIKVTFCAGHAGTTGTPRRAPGRRGSRRRWL